MSSPGQSPPGGIWKLGLEPDAPRCLQNLVIDEIELAFIKLDRVVLTEGLDC
jgi:hypothetical protein